MTDKEHRRAEAVGIAESIAMRLREQPADCRYPEEWADLCRCLREIEDRVYAHGEYATDRRATR